MKPKHLLFAFAALTGLLSVSTAVAADSAKAGKADAKESRVVVIFSHPDQFRDVKDSVMATDKGRDAILSEIKDFIEERGRHDLSPNTRLEITFTDIDLAGEYEPWRTPPADNIRVVKDIYPPRFNFTYKITDMKTGAVLRSGTERLSDLNFMSRLVINRSDELYIEKDILGDWLDSNLNVATATN